MPPTRSPLRPSILIQTDKSLTSDDSNTDRPPSPSAPTWSPITPELKNASLGSVIQNQQQQDGMSQPDSRIPQHSHTNPMQHTNEQGIAGHGRDESRSNTINGAAKSKVTASEAMPPPPSPREREAAARANQAQANHPHLPSSNLHSSPYAHPTPSSTLTNSSPFTTNSLAGPSSTSAFTSVSTPQPQPQSSQDPPLLTQDPPPTTKPIDLSSNTDALALRAAISILSLQREQAVRDMQTLERQKGMALADPMAFASAVKRGEVRSRGLASGLDFSYPGSDDAIIQDQDENGLEEGGEMDVDTTEERQDEKDEQEGTRQRTLPSLDANFGHLPAPQNVVRAPPVNWRQYHIVGPALDALHDAQIRNPDEGRPRTDEDVRQAALRRMVARGEVPGRGNVGGRGQGGGGGRGEERVVLAPYDIFKDEVVRVKVDNEQTVGGEGVGVDAKVKGKGKEGGFGVDGMTVKMERDKERERDKGKGKGKAKAKVGTPKRKRR